MYRFSVEVGRKVSPGLPREAIDTTFLLSKNAKMDGRNPVLAFKTQKNTKWTTGNDIYHPKF